ncbi:MAG TPA: FkbM family methyltransferase [Candidatus Dormibacteraeota bacterium]|nr:FkbM family methyltransferase [Candidatus Dormibacteraeota bacterium]
MNIAARAKFDSSLKCRAELRNWPAVLLRLGLSQFGWSQGVLTVSSRAGVTLRVPNRPLSRYPPIEVLVDDVYRLRDLSWDDPFAPRAVVDVGAHVGSFTCALAERLPGASFTCVEPLPSTLAWLRANLARNGLAGKAAVVPAAVAAADGEAELWASEDACTEASLEAELWASWHASNKASLPPITGRKVEVRTMCFDSIVAAAGGRADIVKLDCEGGEYAAVLTASSGVWATVEQLFLEYHPVAGHHFQELHRRLSEFGLFLVWKRPSRRTGMGMAYFARNR